VPNYFWCLFTSSPVGVSCFLDDLLGWLAGTMASTDINTSDEGVALYAVRESSKFVLKFSNELKGVQWDDPIVVVSGCQLHAKRRNQTFTD